MLGALILAPAQTELSYYVNGQLYLILYGGLFLLIMRLMPRGILPSVSELARTLRLRRRDTLSGLDSTEVEVMPTTAPVAESDSVNEVALP